MLTITAKRDGEKLWFEGEDAEAVRKIIDEPGEGPYVVESAYRAMIIRRVGLESKIIYSDATGPREIRDGLIAVAEDGRTFWRHGRVVRMKYANGAPYGDFCLVVQWIDNARELRERYRPVGLDDESE